MAQKVTFEKVTFESTIQSAIIGTLVTGFAAGLVVGTSLPEKERSEMVTLSSSISDVQVDRLFSKTSAPFRDDPTWTSFMQNIEDYSNYIDALERQSL